MTNKTIQATLAVWVTMLAMTGCSDKTPTTSTQQQEQTARSELEVSAGLAPQLDEAVVANMANFCLEYAPKTRQVVEAALTRWNETNAAHLTVARHYRTRLEDKAANGANEDVRRATQALLDQHATLIESLTNQQLDMIRVAREHERPEVVEELCRDQFAKVTAGEWDIRRRDPDIAAFLDAGIPKQP